MKTLLQIALICLTSSGLAQTLALPPRAAHAPDGDTFAQKISGLDLAHREQAIADQIFAGNVPDFLRTFCPVTVTNIANGIMNCATFFVAPDYLAVGSDENYFLTPLSPDTAQRIAEKLGCVLPTRKMVDAIYAAAEVKLAPSPIPPSAAMTTVPVFEEHNKIVRAQRMALTNSHPLGALVAGHKKDVVISARLAGVTNKVAIYGWHRTNGTPIQPLYLGHSSNWVDYSQCIRLVARDMIVNGKRKSVADVLADPKLCGLISDEGVITNARYPIYPGGSGLRLVVSGVAFETNEVSGSAPGLTDHQPPVTLPQKIQRDAGFDGRDARSTDKQITLPWPEGFSASPLFGEWTRKINSPDDVRILINAPARKSFSPDKPVLLVFYALPNGNTIEQTVGKVLRRGDDWHFGIQHIGAQTRWLRSVITNKTVVVAYLEAGGKSWPTWRKSHDDRTIIRLLEAVRGIFSAQKMELVLAAHSGGGSLTFGYLNAVDKIPDDVERIAFLDSNYAYDTKLHARKIKNWLAASNEHHLCVLAYQDYRARLNGKPFVSEAGGTWGRSRVMLRDLGEQFTFTSRTNNGLEMYSAAGGQIQFLLKENPRREILHTVQAERNGFIQALLSGTPDEGKGYEYLGPRAYTNWIQSGD